MHWLAVNTHDFSTDWLDYVVHFGLDVAGALTTLYVQRFLSKPWQQFVLWLLLTLFITFTTVNLVG